MDDEAFGWDEHVRDAEYTTPAEWDAEEAREIGERNPERAWVCTGRDVWHRNPYYNGPEQPHPEEAYFDEAE